MIPRLVAAALTVAGFLAALLSPIAAHAQSAGTLTFRAQTPYVSSNGTFTLLFDWTGPTSEDITVSGTVFAPISEERAVLDPPTQPFHAIRPQPVSSLRREGELFAFDLDIRSVTDGDETRLLILESGVLPLQLEVRDAEGLTLGALRTNLIRLPTDVAETPSLPVGFVIEVAAAEGLTISGASRLLERHPKLPIAVSIGDGVVRQLEGSIDDAIRFRTALAGRPVIAPAALNLDPSALASIDRGDLYATVQSQTSERLESLGLTVSAETVAVDTNLTQAGVDLLLSLGYRTVLESGERSRPTGVIRGSEDSIQVLQVDEVLTSKLQGRSRSTARVHELLAELAVRWNTDRSPILLGGDSLRSVEASALDTLLVALESPGLLTPVDLRTVVEESALLLIRPDEQPSQDLSFVRQDIEEFTTELLTYEQFHINGDPSPESFSTNLLSALTRDLNPADRSRAMTRLRDNLRSALGGVILPDGQSVTLATLNANIPITVENRSSGTRSVLLEFESDKIEVDQDGELIALPPGSSTIDIDLEARSLGLSPLTVRIFTPDRSEELASTRFAVRSTAIPGLGLLLSAAAFVFLIAWWLVSFSRAKTAKAREEDATSETPASSSPGEEKAKQAETPPAESIDA